MQTTGEVVFHSVDQPSEVHALKLDYVNSITILLAVPANSTDAEENSNIFPPRILSGY